MEYDEETLRLQQVFKWAQTRGYHTIRCPSVEDATELQRKLKSTPEVEHGIFIYSIRPVNQFAADLIVKAVGIDSGPDDWVKNSFK